jgi:hypothetical protein
VMTKTEEDALHTIQSQELEPSAKNVEGETNSMHENDDRASSSSYIDKAPQVYQEDSSSNNKDELYWSKGKWRDYLQEG